MPSTITAAAGRLNDEHISRLHFCAGASGQRLDAAVRTLDLVDAHGARGAARHAEGGHAAAIGENARGHRLEKTDASHPAVAAAPAPGAARTGADGEALHPDGIAPFQHFGVGQAGVGHMRLHHGGTVEAAGLLALSIEHASRAGAARDGLVILMLRVAEGEVVHGALARGLHAQCAEQRVGHAHADLHIARDHGGGRPRRQHRALGHDEMQGLEATGVERNVVVHQAAKHVQHRRHGNGLGRVEIVGLLRRGAGEVDLGFAPLSIDTDRHTNACAAIELQAERAVVQRADHPAHRGLGVVLHMLHIGAHHVQTIVGHEFAQFVCAGLVGRDLRLEVGQVLLRIARWPASARQQRQHLGLAQTACVHQLEVVDHHAFFKNAARERRHGARRDAADVGMVAA